MGENKSNKGHYKRLRDRFMSGGLDGFHDYEVVELLLTFAGRKDVKQSAKGAIKKFGSLKAVLEADPIDLKEIKGIGDNNVFGLKIAQAVARRYLADRVIDKDFIRSSDEVLDYLQHNLRDKNREVFLVIYLNEREPTVHKHTNTVTRDILFSGKIVSGDMLYCIIRCGYSEFKSNDTTQSWKPTLGSFT